MPEYPANLDDLICFDLYAANLGVGRLYKPLLDDMGVTYPQYLVLTVLWENDARSVSEIGALLGLESSTLTPLIKRLEAQELVTRRRAPEDERRVVVRLTGKGEALRARRGELSRCIVAAAGLDLAEFGQLRALLRKLRAGLAGA